jgi:hypothetical protein
MPANVLRLDVGGGFLALKFNRRTALETITKLSYEEPHPTLCVALIMGYRILCSQGCCHILIVTVPENVRPSDGQIPGPG